MISFFPKQISYRAIITYLLALVAISFMYNRYVMLWGYIVLGITCVTGFFLLTNRWTQPLRTVGKKEFLKNLFLIALSIRLIWVVASYFYYIDWTGIPFEFDAADSIGYHEEATWLAGSEWFVTWQWYFGERFHGLSDIGYPLYLTFLYKIFGPSIIITRLFKAIISAYTCILIYKLSSRTLGENAGRMAAIMCVLMPNLIIYCGYHLKETEMLFLEVAFLERADYLYRTRKWNFINILCPSILAASLFLFRTVLGAAAIFSFATATLLSNTPTMKTGSKRIAIIGWGILCVLVFGGGTIMTEVEALWEGKDSNLSSKRFEQTVRGNQWAQYATGAVMAPMVFVLPFSTMVNVDQQYAQQAKHSGNFIRNFMGFFAILAIYESIRRKQWKDFSLIGAFVIAYLGVISLTGFSNSERFLLPGLPCLIVMWAYGVSTLRTNTYKLLTPWCAVVIAMELAWAFFKLGSRGLL